jgi:hypothetical protein
VEKKNHDDSRHFVAIKTRQARDVPFDADHVVGRLRCFAWCRASQFRHPPIVTCGRFVVSAGGGYRSPGSPGFSFDASLVVALWAHGCFQSFQDKLFACAFDGGLAATQSGGNLPIVHRRANASVIRQQQDSCARPASCREHKVRGARLQLLALRQRQLYSVDFTHEALLQDVCGGPSAASKNTG